MDREFRHRREICQPARVRAAGGGGGYTCLGRSRGSALAAIVLLIVLVCVGYTPAYGTVIVDRTAPSLWQGNSLPLVHTDGPGVEGLAALKFRGNGEKIISADLLFAIDQGGIPNQGDLDALAWNFMFWGDEASYLANPFGDLVGGVIRTTLSGPVNTDWKDVIGQTGGFDVRRASFDLSHLNILTTDGALQLLSIQPRSPVFSDQGTSIPFAGPGGIGSEVDWYAAYFESPPFPTIFAGPNSYEGFRISGEAGFVTNFGTWRLETQAAQPPTAEAVPEPGTSLFALAGAAVGLAARRRRRAVGTTGRG